MPVYTYIKENENQHSDEAVALVETAIQSVLNESLADRFSKVGAGLDKAGAKVKNSAEYLGNAAKGFSAIAKEKKEEKKEFNATHSKPTLKDKRLEQKMRSEAKAATKNAIALDAEQKKANDNVARLRAELAKAEAKARELDDKANML